MASMFKPICLCVVGVFFAIASVAAQDISTLPADAEGSQDALQASPRHGEWVDVPVPDSDTTLRTWVVYPERPDAAPVVIVIHEIYGLTDWIRTVADALAAEG